MFLTIAFVLYAVVGAATAGLLIARSRRDSVRDEAVENRLNGTSTARSAEQRVPGVAGRHRLAP